MNEPPGTQDPEPDPGGELPAAVQALIRQHVGSFEELEALLFLFQRRGAAWSLDALAPELRLKAEDLDPALKKLEASRLLESKGQAYAYPARPGPSDQAVEWLCSARESHRLAILRWMTLCAIERMRSSAWSVFAESFRLRGRSDG